MVIKAGMKVIGLPKTGRREGDKDTIKIKEAYLEAIKRNSSEQREDSTLKQLNKVANRQLMRVTYEEDFESFIDLLLTEKQMNEVLEGSPQGNRLWRKLQSLKGIFNKIILKMSESKEDKIMLDSSEWMDFYYQDLECGLRLYTYWVNRETTFLIEKKSYKKFYDYIINLRI